jgi:hypothetical protein
VRNDHPEGKGKRVFVMVIMFIQLQTPVYSSAIMEHFIQRLRGKLEMAGI